MFVSCGEEDVSDVVSLLESTSKDWEEIDLFGLSLGERTNTIDGKRHMLKLLFGGSREKYFCK